MVQKAYKFQAQVQPQGKVEVVLPLPTGTPVEVLVLTSSTDDFQDLRDAASLTMDFWNNPVDEAEWNNA